MLAVTEHAPAMRPVELPLDVAILSVATAVPGNVISQTDTARRARTVWPQYADFESLYANTGIERRFAVEPIDWYYGAPGWEDRSAIFTRHAADLLETAARDAVRKAGLRIDEVDALVVNTITGVAVPSLDAHLINRIEFRNDVERLPIFGFGCGGGVAGLSRAARLAIAMPGRAVLFLTIDLCTLCLRVKDQSLAMFVSAALFGDGAAAVVLRAPSPEDTGETGGGVARIRATGEHFWRDTQRIMGWDMKEDGFGVVLSPELPVLMQRKLEPALAAFLSRHGLSLADFDGFLFHPGGSRVLETVQAKLGLTRDDLVHSWRVLRDFGNMSSATALFVLDDALRSGATGRHLLSAFGPGFSAYFAVVDL